MGEFKFTAEEASFIVEADGKKLRVSLKETDLPWGDAQKWCAEHGGGNECVDNLRLLAKYRSQINNELKAIGVKPLGGWYWTNERSYVSPDATAFVVDLDDGDVINSRQYCYIYVRAVSAL